MVNIPDNAEKTEVRLMVHVEIKVQIWKGPDNGHFQNWCAEHDPVWGHKAGLARIIDQSKDKRNSPLAKRHIDEMAGLCADFVGSSMPQL